MPRRKFVNLEVYKTRNVLLLPFRTCNISNLNSYNYLYADIRKNEILIYFHLKLNFEIEKSELQEYKGSF